MTDPCPGLRCCCGSATPAAPAAPGTAQGHGLGVGHGRGGERGRKGALRERKKGLWVQVNWYGLGVLGDQGGQG